MYSSFDLTADGETIAALRVGEGGERLERARRREGAAQAAHLQRHQRQRRRKIRPGGRRHDRLQRCHRPLHAHLDGRDGWSESEADHLGSELRRGHARAPERGAPRHANGGRSHRSHRRHGSRRRATHDRSSAAPGSGSRDSAPMGRPCSTSASIPRAISGRSPSPEASRARSRPPIGYSAEVSPDSRMVAYFTVPDVEGASPTTCIVAPIEGGAPIATFTWPPAILDAEVDAGWQGALLPRVEGQRRQPLHPAALRRPAPSRDATDRRRHRRLSLARPTESASCCKRTIENVSNLWSAGTDGRAPAADHRLRDRERSSRSTSPRTARRSTSSTATRATTSCS